jgi:hypothetical protein
MKMKRNLLLSAALFSTVLSLSGQVDPTAQYHIYAGSTHAHTAYTWSHGEQFSKNDCAGISVFAPIPGSPDGFRWSDGYVKSKNGCANMFVINGFQYPSPNVIVKPDWEKFQGPPSKHFELAKEAGYDFYITTDHSQEAQFQPTGPENPTWLSAKRQAAQATTPKFAAIAGYEHSENDGPGGMGHLNVMNSSGMVNALAAGIDLPYFYKWLATATPNGEGPVVASFNHPGPDQYNNWDYRDDKVTDVITMLEVLNSNNKVHYEAFVNALAHGWKVSPVAGNDNHGLTGIARNTSRTFVLAKSASKRDILEAMKERRTYASLDGNLQCRYSVNGAVMGSTLDHPQVLRYHIVVSDPDTGNPKNKITKIDIVKDGGVVVETYTPTPGYSVEWSPTINDSTSKALWVRVWNAGGGDAADADPAKPVAWLAPVWTGR